MNLSRGGLLAGFLIGGILSAVFGIGFAAGAVFDRREVSSQIDLSNPDVRNFLATYRLVTQRSYYRVSQRRLMYAAINGMLSATGDPHTVFLPTAQNRSANAQLNGQPFTGIGAMVRESRGLLQVLAPIPNGPAARAGIRENDLIIAINGRSARGLSASTALGRIHGAAGTVVRLTVRRGRGEKLVIPVTRARLPAITAYGRMLPHRLGYVQVLSFGANTATQVAQALTDLKRRRMRALVLDLRGNPGGYVDAAQRIVSRFVARGVVAYERTPNKTLVPLPVLPNMRITSVRVAVLVDANSASAAEITAAALRDDDRATIIGTRTYGKGSMQSVYSLAGGASVRITDRLWLTPRKRSIGGVGIRPDVRITAGGPGDPALRTATQFLSRSLR